MASPPVTKPLGKACSNSLQAHLLHFQARPTDGKSNQQALVVSLLSLWLTTSRVLSARARSNSLQLTLIGPVLSGCSSAAQDRTPYCAACHGISGRWGAAGSDTATGCCGRAQPS